MSILRRIGILDTALTIASRFADAWMMDKIYRAMPGLYEWLWDESPPGGGVQVVQGEDHSGSGYDGGVEIPRNCHLSVGYGSGDKMMWQLNALTAAMGWTPADASHTNPRSTDLGYHWPAYVSPGVDSVTHAGLFVEGWVAVYVDEEGGTLDIRITNTLLAQSSAISTITRNASIKWVHIGEIPVQPDLKNTFLLEYQNPGDVEAITVQTYGYIQSEVYLAGAHRLAPYNAPLSQPPLTGTVA